MSSSETMRCDAALGLVGMRALLCRPTPRNVGGRGLGNCARLRGPTAPAKKRKNVSARTDVSTVLPFSEGGSIYGSCQYQFRRPKVIWCESAARYSINLYDHFKVINPDFGVPEAGYR